MPAPTYASEPQIQYLHQLLDQIEAGELLVPDFQRPARWKDEQRKKLLESVSEGLPIGSVMVWRTSVEIPFREWIGPHHLPERPLATARQYLLDGFQRMSTLFAVLRRGEDETLTEVEADEDGHRWRLGYHLVEEEWVFLDDVDPKDLEYGIVLPGHLVLDSVELIRFQRKIRHPDVDTLVDRSDTVVRAIREYKLPLIPMVTDEIDQATRTFGLLNSEGTPMSDLDLIVALTWTQDHNLRGRIDSAKDKLGRVGWGKLDERYLLAAVRAAFDIAIYDSAKSRHRSAMAELSRCLGEQPTVFDEVVAALVDVAGLLARRCGVVSLDLLPYSYQAVLLADVIRRHPKRSEQVDDALVQWFWWTTGWQTFAGMSGYRMTAMLGYLRKLGAGESVDWPWRLSSKNAARLPATSDPRGALVRAVAIELFLRQDRDVQVKRRLEVHAAGALVRGLGGLLSNAQARSLGNSFLVSVDAEPLLISDLATAAEGGDDLVLLSDPAVRRHHYIPDSSWTRLLNGDRPGFVRERAIAVEEGHRNFLNGIGRPPGVD